MILQNLLGDSGLYQAQIEKLRAKHAQSKKMYTLTQQGVPLLAISMNDRKVARMLAKAVSRGRYECTPATARYVKIGNKERLLYEFNLTDMVVQRVIATILMEHLEQHLSPHVYSFRKGMSWATAVLAFARYIRAHRAARPDPETRGLYVVRRDIRKYADSIPVHAKSKLWPQLKHVLCFENNSDSVSDYVWKLVQRMIRPEAYSAERFLCSNIRGIPTGAPIATPVFNLYLSQLDRELDAIPEAFYARYCDDFLFAHPNARVAQQAERQIDDILEDLSLKTSPEKNSSLYLNGAAKPSALWRTAESGTTISYLGCQVAFQGTVSLTKEKVRHLLKDLEERSWRTRKALPCKSREEAGPAVCAAINQALDPHSPFSHNYARLLRSVITDRSQLRQLDHCIARIVLRIVTGRPSIKGFRTIPLGRLRHEWKLVSLYHRRNIHGYRRAVTKCER